ncbi:hypothetical protein ABBQ32_011005 [Trebouxia sp. C0010 RCD-2024]
MAAQIQAFMLACPVSPTAGRAVRWDQLKVHIQDVARNYCSTFHADRTKQLRALRVRAGLARAAYLADPTSQPALDQLRHTAADLSSFFFCFFFFLGGRAIHYIFFFFFFWVTGEMKTSEDGQRPLGRCVLS